MKKTLKGNENYQAKVFRITGYKKHENANKLFIVTIDFNNVITGVEPKIGDLYVYFPVLSKINTNFISEINGFSNSELNKDTTQKGFFTNSGRVKPIKLRGISSEGYIHPVQPIEKFLNYSLKEGDEFNSVNDIVLCQKYIIKSENSEFKINQPKKSKESRIIDGQFKFHNDTENLRRNIFKISPDDLIEISYKKHGTSLVISNILTKRKLSRFELFLKFFGVPINDTEYGIIYSSRRVIKNPDINNNAQHYYNTDIWGIAANEIKNKIPSGYSLYCEILGYTPDGAYIQNQYDYGCIKGEHKVYVYKITFTNSEGFTINLSTPQIKEFCDKYELNFSDTLIYYGYARDLFDIDIEKHWHEEFLKKLEERYANDEDCYMCKNKVPKEGIVLVKQNMFDYEAYKLKSFSFLYKTEDSEAEQNISNIEDIN